MTSNHIRLVYPDISSILSTTYPFGYLWRYPSCPSYPQRYPMISVHNILILPLPSAGASAQASAAAVAADIRILTSRPLATGTSPHSLLPTNSTSPFDSFGSLLVQVVAIKWCVHPFLLPIHYGSRGDALILLPCAIAMEVVAMEWFVCFVADSLTAVMVMTWFKFIYPNIRHIRNNI